MMQLIETSQQALWLVFVVFVRVGAAMSVMPVFGERSVPVRIRLILSLAMAVIVAPAVYATISPPVLGLGSLARILMTETIAGLALGIALRLFILALQTAGAIAAQSTSLSQLTGNNAMDPMPAIGQALTVSALALVMMTGLHVKAAALFIFSYEAMPLGTFPDAAVLGEWGQAQVNQAFRLGFTLAGPFVILSMLYNLTLGVINKAMPQLMVAFVGAPVITLGAISMLFTIAPVLLGVWNRALDAFLINPFGMP
ncbi:flagellar biosynthetic protein FliR [Puniceibacterium sediminis]|uniref:Flagellar biosynthetic protein FliR n=1 Tax=Puniceibacterium sediminis TaxID=1608407 RepID=A0A238VS37_9RHOB|nr:flagellar biosynthetic protein FliR [Puniceibacterium sediminis]SNR37115.1 flagellar biosynthetic protein FliR [Puniceibacterium sediminis]